MAAKAARGPPAGMPVATAALILLLVNVYSEAAVQMLAAQTGQPFAACNPIASALAFVVAGLRGRRGRGQRTGDPASPAAWWMVAGLLLMARPALTASAGVFLASNSAPPASQLALLARLTATALTSTLPGLWALGNVLVSTATQLPLPSSVLIPAATACGVLAVLLPPVVQLPWHACTAPALAAVAAAAAAYRRSPSRRRLRRNAALLLVASAAAAQALACTRCGPGQRRGGAGAALWSCQLRQGGRLSVVERANKEGQYRYRLMRLDHSVMGGQWVWPPSAAGQSIYTAFHVQQVPRLLRPGGARSLHIGLGAGTAVGGMQRHGVTADVVELHGEIIQAAASFFNLTAAGTSVAGDAAVALQLLPPGTAYDYIVLDVFAGGASASRLGAPAFFAQLKSLLLPGGVLAVNVYGMEGPALDGAACSLLKVFASVRCFGDLEPGAVKNFVLAASDAGGFAAADVGRAADAEEAAGGGLDPLEARVFGQLAAQEVRLAHLDRRSCQRRAAAGWAGVWALQARVALAHWRAMRQQFGDELWTT